MASAPGWRGPEDMCRTLHTSQDAVCVSCTRLGVVTFWLRLSLSCAAAWLCGERRLRKVRVLPMVIRPVIRIVGLERLVTSISRRHATGADLSSLILPPWLDGLLNHDRVAYPLHAACGRVLNWLGASPRVTALEWLKAAAHAESAASQSVVAAGLRRTIQRARVQDVQLVLRAAVVRPVTADGRDVRMRRRQLAALARAGVEMPDERRG